VRAAAEGKLPLRERPRQIPEKPTFDWTKLVAAKNKELDRLVGVYGRIMDNNNVEMYEGRGTIVDAHTVDVNGKQFKCALPVTLTHTRSLSLSYSHTHTLSISLLLSHTHALYLSLTLSHTRSLSISYSHTHSLSSLDTPLAVNAESAAASRKPPGSRYRATSGAGD
jgi:hypothetical protein